MKSLSPDRATSELEEQLYAMAAQEVASKNTKPGLMAKAFAEADGERDRATALYIRLRVAQLREELGAEIEAARQFEAHRQEVERKAVKQQCRTEAVAREKARVDQARKRMSDPVEIEKAKRVERTLLIGIGLFIAMTIALILVLALASMLLGA